MGTSYNFLSKVGTEISKSHEVPQTAIAVQSKPIAKSEESPKQDELATIIKKVEGLLGVKVVGHMLIDDFEEENGKDGILIKCIGQKNDSLDRKMEPNMILARKRKELLKDSKFFDLVD
jgi:hypothetical protein